MNVWDLARRYETAMRESLQEIADEVLEDAKRQTPVLPPDEVRPGTGYSGQLRDSGRAELEEVPGGVVVRLRFMAPYAVKQHEHKGLDHPHGGKAKFLADPVKAMTPRLRAELARRIREKMAAGDA